MIVGVFGDVHLTKNMRGLQHVWEESATSSILDMYKNFDQEMVEFVVCLGDFFDKPIIEAKNLHLVLPILNIMNSKSYPTYLLLGNHEIDDNEHNILEYLAEYENIKPITDSDIIRNEFLFIPYNVNPADLDADMLKDRYVFTHHDIYGSDLASGKTKAFFGLDPSIFKDSKLVMNGHVHLKSRVAKNILNAGSLLVSQQGELRVGDYPSYYILDSDRNKFYDIENHYSMIYQAIDESDMDKLIKYNTNNLVLRVDYEGEIPEITTPTAHTSWRKKIEDIGESKDTVVNTSNFDMKSYVVDYLMKSDDISAADKDSYIRAALELLE